MFRRAGRWVADTVFGWVSRKVLVHALAAGALVVVQETGQNSAWLQHVPLPVQGLVIVALPALVAWLKSESNPAPSSQP